MNLKPTAKPPVKPGKNSPWTTSMRSNGSREEDKGTGRKAQSSGQRA